jgi:hypothetical protein
MLSRLDRALYPSDFHQSMVLNTFWVVDDKGAPTASESQHPSSNNLKGIYPKLGPVSLNVAEQLGIPLCKS